MHAHFEFWNIIDLLVALLSAISLAMMAATTRTDAVDIDLLRCFQATAGLLGGIKLLSFLRGLDFSAFLISMLEAIVADMVNFFAVLLVIMVSCVLCLESPPALVTASESACPCAYRACVVQLCLCFLLAPPGFSAGLPNHLQLHCGAGTSAFMLYCVD